MDYPYNIFTTLNWSYRPIRSAFSVHDRLMFNICSNEGEKQKQNLSINKLLKFSMCHIKK